MVSVIWATNWVMCDVVVMEVLSTEVTNELKLKGYCYGLNVSVILNSYADS